MTDSIDYSKHEKITDVKKTLLLCEKYYIECRKMEGNIQHALVDISQKSQRICNVPDTFHKMIKDMIALKTEFKELNGSIKDLMDKAGECPIRIQLLNWEEQDISRDFPMDLRHKLRSIGIRKNKDLINSTQEQLISINGIGEKYLSYIQAELEEHGYILKNVAVPSVNLQETLNIRIEDIELTVRSSNCLSYTPIRTIRDLIQKSEADLLKYRNFGRKSLNEIKAKLADYGLSLNMGL